MSYIPDLPSGVAVVVAALVSAAGSPAVVAKLTVLVLRVCMTDGLSVTCGTDLATFD